MPSPRIGLALGSGGARGLAHIIILEAFEELNIKPTIISGSSIGAVIGAGFASGMSCGEMKNSVRDMLTYKESKFWEIHKKSDIIKLFDMLDPGRKIGGIIKGDKFSQYFYDHVKANTFQELQIPLKIITTDYWTRKEVILTEGDLSASVRASYSLPGLLAPVPLNGFLLMDGGMVNPLPYDVIKGECDITVAVDITPKKSVSEKDIPPAYEILFSAFQIMQNSIINEKLKVSQPDIFIRTDITGVKMLEFTRMDEIYRQALPYKKKLKDKLRRMIKHD